MNKTTPALSVQIGGSHYKDCAIQPVQFIEANNLAFLEGCVVKRLARHDKPTGKGRQDIEKAIHELQLILELRYPMTANDNKAASMDSVGEVQFSYLDSKRALMNLGQCKAKTMHDLCAECQAAGHACLAV